MPSNLVVAAEGGITCAVQLCVYCVSGSVNVSVNVSVMCNVQV